MSKYAPFGGKTYNLGSSIGSTDTTILLSSFLEPVTGTPYTMVLLNTDIAYGTIAPKTNQAEFISFTGIVQNADGTATLTGVVRGLAKKYPFTTDVAYKLPHAGQTQFIISDAPQVFEKYPAKENNENITGLWNFTQTPTGLNPGAVQDASTTVKGIGKVSVAPALSTNPIFVGDNDPRVPTQGENDALVGDNTDIAVGTGNKFVTQTGLQKQAESYAASATGNDTYVVTLVPVPISYTNGMVVRFKADVGNTGAATLNVNSLGAITIKKQHDVDLETGDIEANQIVEVVYNSTGPVFEMMNQLASVAAPSKSIYSFTAGETLAAGNPTVALSYSSSAVAYDTSASATGTGTAVSTTFAVASNTNKILIVGINNTNNSFTVNSITYNGVGLTKLVEVTGLNTGKAAIWYLLNPSNGSNTLTANVSSSDTVYMNIYSYYNVAQTAPETSTSTAGTTETVSTNLTPLTNGAMIFGAASGTGNGTPTAGGSVYTNHLVNAFSGLRMITGDSGNIYPPSAQSMSYTQNGSSQNNAILLASIAPVATSLTTRVYKTSAAQATTANAFVGFAQGAATIGNTVTIATGGVDTNQSGLTIGAQYYLANTSGTLGTSAGTVTRKAGIAISATEILITNIW